MSIYLIKKELIDILKDSNLNFRVDNEQLKPVTEIVYSGGKSKYLDFDNYSEDVLKQVLKNKKRVVYVDLEFWNYNYCTKENINPEYSSKIIEKLSVLVDSTSSFSEGTIIVLILLHQFLLNIYKIQDTENFKEYFSKLNLSKKIIKNFLLNNNYLLPVNKNFMEVIKKILDPESVTQFIVKNDQALDRNEIRKIFCFFELNNIHEEVLYVRNHIKKDERFLQYVFIMLDIFDRDIDSSNVVVYKKDPVLGVCLLTLEVSKKLQTMFYEVMKVYIEKNGSLNIKVCNDKNLEIKIKKKSEEVENYFEKNYL